MTQQQHPSLSRPLVLVAHHDDDMRLSMMERLMQGGFSVVGASDGDEALEIAHHSAPRAVVVDLAMPEVDGLKMIAWMRSERSLRSTPVLVLSDIEDGEVAKRALAGGADDVIVSNLSAEALASRIDWHLSVPATWTQAHAESIDFEDE